MINRATLKTKLPPSLIHSMEVLAARNKWDVDLVHEEAIIHLLEYLSIEVPYTDGMKKPKLGTGERFKKLATKLSAKGVKDPDALAASIGRKKYGAKKMTRLAIAGKKK